MGWVGSNQVHFVGSEQGSGWVGLGRIRARLCAPDQTSRSQPTIPHSKQKATVSVATATLSRKQNEEKHAVSVGLKSLSRAAVKSHKEDACESPGPGSKICQVLKLSD